MNKTIIPIRLLADKQATQEDFETCGGYDIFNDNMTHSVGYIMPTEHDFAKFMVKAVNSHQQLLKVLELAYGKLNEHLEPGDRLLTEICLTLERSKWEGGYEGNIIRRCPVVGCDIKDLHNHSSSGPDSTGQ